MKNVKVFVLIISNILAFNHGKNKLGFLVCNFDLLLLSGHPDSSYSPGDYQYDAAASYDYDYGPDSSYSEEEVAKDVHKPVILSQPSQIQVEIGHTIRLPCTVDRLPGEIVCMNCG